MAAGATSGSVGTPQLPFPAPSVCVKQMSKDVKKKKRGESRRAKKQTLVTVGTIAKLIGRVVVLLHRFVRLRHVASCSLRINDCVQQVFQSVFLEKKTLKRKKKEKNGAVEMRG